MSDSLKFREDGSFVIAQLTDLHFCYGVDEQPGLRDDERTDALIRRLLDTIKPDLVVITGDLMWSGACTDQVLAIRKATAAVIDSDYPWAAVLGNHDSETEFTREEVMAVLQENERFLGVKGPSEINGVGNYVLTVKDRAGNKDAAALYFFDSGEVAPKEIGGYAWIHPDQVHWYTQQSAQLAAMHGAPVPSLAFFHIPVPEYVQAAQAEDVSGTYGEEVCAPKVNTGLLGAMVHMKDVMGTFVGHDHDNDYCGTVQGIKLCYGRATGYNTYGKLKRGMRVIRMQEGARSFDTWIVEDDA